jgi:SAM-dependent MidA family methyltransferase
MLAIAEENLARSQMEFWDQLSLLLSMLDFGSKNYYVTRFLLKIIERLEFFLYMYVEIHTWLTQLKKIQQAIIEETNLYIHDRKRVS